jgi:hypothetical protein
MIPLLQFSVSRVWPCSSCRYLAKSDISSAACPNCGNIGLEGSNARSNSSPKRLLSETQGISSDSTLSETVYQDAKTFAPGSLDPSTLFIPAAEASSDMIMRISSCLGTDISINFGEYLVSISAISRFYANQPAGRLVWDYCCGIPYRCSSASYTG